MDLYRDIILDHYKNPRNFGKLDHPDHVSHGSNASCGDQIEIQVKILNSKLKTEKKISEIKFHGVGCAISMAVASMLTEYAKTHDLKSILKLKRGDVEKMLGTTLTISRVKCGLLPLEVLQEVINQLS
jgi:nitrogen fixation protein NifU and related proteins